MRGAEARAGPVADAAVERDADDRDVRPLHLVEPRQSRERRDARESGHDARVDRAAWLGRAVDLLAMADPARRVAY